MANENKGRRLTRFYANGERRTLHENTTMVGEYASVEDWINYNRSMRFGNALFVDGECVYNGMGYHTAEALAKYSAQEKAIIADGSAAERHAGFEAMRDAWIAAINERIKIGGPLATVA